MAQQITKSQMSEIQKALTGLKEREISADKLAEEDVIDLNKIQNEVPGGVNKANGSIYNAGAGIAGEIAGYKERIDELEKSVKEQKKGVLETMKGLVTGKPTVDVVAEQKKLYEEWGIPEYYEKLQAITPEISSLMEQINTLKAEQERELLAKEQQLIGRPGAIVYGEKNFIKRQYAIDISAMSAELGAKAAVAEMYRGNISLARGLVSDAVEAYTYTIQQERADMDNLYTFYGDYLSTLDTETQRELDQIRADLEKDETRIRTDKTNVMNLMLEYPRAGIRLEDTIEEATKKASEWSAVQVEEVAETAETALEKEYEYLGGKRGTGLTLQEFFAARKGMEFIEEPVSQWYNTETGKMYSGENPPGTGWIKVKELTRPKLQAVPKELEKWEKEGIVWEWLGSDIAKGFSDEQKITFIMQYGLNPETFGIY